MHDSKFTLISTLIVLIILAFLSSLFILNAKKTPNALFVFRDIGHPSLPDSLTYEIYEEHKVGQKFQCNFPNLFRVGIFISNSKNNSRGDLIFHLKDSPIDKNDLVKIRIPTSNIKQNKYDFYNGLSDPSSETGVFYYIEFNPIKKSKNRIFYFYLEAPLCQKGEGYKVGFFNKENYLGCRSCQAYFNDKPQKGYLAFQTFCSWQGNISDILNEIKNNFSKDINFMKLYISVCIILFLILIIIFWISIKRRT